MIKREKREQAFNEFVNSGGIENQEAEVRKKEIEKKEAVEWDDFLISLFLFCITLLVGVCAIFTGVLLRNWFDGTLDWNEILNDLKGW